MKILITIINALRPLALIAAGTLLYIKTDSPWMSLLLIVVLIIGTRGSSND